MTNRTNGQVNNDRRPPHEQVGLQLPMGGGPGQAPGPLFCRSSDP
jgi:hypothetical protein